MNRKLSKLLISVSAIITASALSFIPDITAKAVPNVYYYQATTSTVQVQDSLNTPDITNAVITWSIPGANSQSELGNADSQYVIFAIDADGYGVIAAVNFYDSITTTGTCTVSYSLSYLGTDYTGSLQLSSQDNHDFTGSYFSYNSNFEDTSSEFTQSINNKICDIDMAFKGLNPDGTENPDKTVVYECKGAVNSRIISALAKSEGVTLLYTFEYEGYVFTSTITSEDAARIFSADIPWYGPCYIASNCPTVMVGVAV